MQRRKTISSLVFILLRKYEQHPEMVGHKSSLVGFELMLSIATEVKGNSWYKKDSYTIFSACISYLEGKDQQNISATASTSVDHHSNNQIASEAENIILEHFTQRVQQVYRSYS